MQYNLNVFKAPVLPHYIQLELTNDCNLKCNHCSRQNFMDKRPVEYMDINLFQKIIDEISGCPQCFVRIGGLGEQALHPDFGKMMDYLKEKSICFEIVTNGLLLTKFSPQRIMDSGIKVLGISVDGNDSDSYNQLRPGGNYDLVREKIINFYREKIKNNKKHPELQIRSIIFPNTTSEQIRIFKQNWMHYSDYIRFNTLNTGQDEIVKSPKRCLEIDFTIHIRSNGKIPLCGYQHWYSEVEWIGDIRFNSLQSIWKNPRLNELRKAHCRINLDNFEFCKRCFKTQHGEKCKDNIIKWNEHRNPVIGFFRSLTKFFGKLR